MKLSALISLSLPQKYISCREVNKDKWFVYWRKTQSTNQGVTMIKLRKMVTITLCTRQQKRHWCIEQSYGLCGRGRGWEDLGEWQWNM